MGIGFAIPVSSARQVLDAIVRDGQVTRGWIGVEPQELNAELAQAFSVKTGSGVIITGVLQNGPAAQAGVRPGDVITAVAGRPVKNVSELLGAVAALKPGEPAKLAIERRDQRAELSVTPAKRPGAKRTR
jgi:S1-C subfamily serine protease